MDVGAYELQPPVITGLIPTSTPKGTGVSLEIEGTGFLQGAAVTLTAAAVGSFPAVTVTPAVASVTPTLITVTITPTELYQLAISDSIDTLINQVTQFPVSVVVYNPDASGLPPSLTPTPTNVIPSLPNNPPPQFDIAPPSSVVITPPAVNPINNENDVLPASGATAFTIYSTDPDATTWSAANLPPGLSITSTGSNGIESFAVISGTVGAYDGQNSPYNVTITNNDDGVPGSTHFSWMVNVAPLSIPNPGNQVNTEGDTVSLPLQTGNADPGSFSASGLPPGLTITFGGLIHGTIDLGDAQTLPYVVTIHATHDLVPGSIQFDWTVNPLPPTVNSPGPQVNKPGDTIAPLTITATGADPNTFSETGLPPGLSITTAGVIQGMVLNTDGGVYTVTVTATHDGAKGSANFTWSVPTLVAPLDQVDNPLDQVNLQLSTQVYNSFTAKGLPPGLSISNTGLITGTINPSDLGNYQVTITATYQTVSAAISFNWLITTNAVATTVVVGTDGSLHEFSPTANNQVLSPAGTIQSASAVVDIHGVTAVYAIVTGAAGPQYANTLWENYNGMWSDARPQRLLQADQRHHRLQRLGRGLRRADGRLAVAGAGRLRPRHRLGRIVRRRHQFQSISVITDTSGNQWCYAIATLGDTLWLHGPAFPAGWQEISTGLLLGPGERRPELGRPGGVVRPAVRRFAVGAEPGLRRHRPEHRLPPAVGDQRLAVVVPERGGGRPGQGVRHRLERHRLGALADGRQGADAGDRDTAERGADPIGGRRGVHDADRRLVLGVLVGAAGQLRGAATPRRRRREFDAARVTAARAACPDRPDPGIRRICSPRLFYP